MSNLLGLLGRPPICVEVDGSYLAGRRVLVTGAGGSIGAELCRQVATHRPAELILMGRGESTLLATHLTTMGNRRIVLADIRDRSRLERLFNRYRPHVVFHAAALKHQPILEREPGEAVKTNVWGTANVLAAAATVGVERLINVSTDKAADPTCVLGASKRITERLTAWYAPRRYLSVRFGNVLGSRGSVLTVFAHQLASGGPLTLTHPDVTRYFMTIPEAAALVITAGAIGNPGEALILDMGVPVRIADLAHRMAAVMGVTPLTVFTGLRPNEKLHETLVGTGERPARPAHPLIDHVDVPPLGPRHVTGIEAASHHAAVARQLADLCVLHTWHTEPLAVGPAA